ncbi:hypothetical protein HN777_02965 [Candidatus Woesearchaeota archaeon]|jgi:hypothetical protein|nr:hypothetical protein [Candidatus Woesearchaeota archaeon]MBT7402723.1 hypothetical protein [Candidatus Woesearchaeota archaeon]
MHIESNSYIRLPINNIRKGFGDPELNIVKEDLTETLKINNKSYPIIEIYFVGGSWLTNNYDVIEVAKKLDMSSIIAHITVTPDFEKYGLFNNTIPRPFKDSKFTSFFFEDMNEFDENSMRNILSKTNNYASNILKLDTDFLREHSIDYTHNRLTISEEEEINNINWILITPIILGLRKDLIKEHGRIRSINGILSDFIKEENAKVLQY